jgi:quinol monooxygenase YgiN
MKRTSSFFRILVVGAVLSAPLTSTFAQDAKPSGPETVLATFRVKPNQLDAFLKLMPEYWAALRTRNLVLNAPHVVLRGEENGRPIVIEVFRWRDHDAPEHVPPAIQQYWDKINAMVENRNGHSGIEFPEMTMVATKE